MLFSLSGRDDADDFFALTFLPIYVDYKQHGDDSRLDPQRADCVPALLSRFGIDAVRSDEAMLVFENESRQFERDSAMVPADCADFLLRPIRTALCIHILYYAMNARWRWLLAVVTHRVPWFPARRQRSDVKLPTSGLLDNAG
jgi:hypothetical protein